MSKWSTALVALSVLVRPGLATAADVDSPKPEKPTASKTRKTRQVSEADAFYKQGAVQVVHLQVSDA